MSDYIDSIDSIAMKESSRRWSRSRKPSKFSSLQYDPQIIAKYRYHIQDLRAFAGNAALQVSEAHFQHRLDAFLNRLNEIYKRHGGLVPFGCSYRQLGFAVDDGAVTYSEINCRAVSVFLFGEFNNFNKNQHALERREADL